MVDVFLFPGEPNPNDVKLRIGSQKNGAASGDIIVVVASVVGGVAKGTKPDDTGGGLLHTPSFPFHELPFKKRKPISIPATAEGQIVEVFAFVKSGRARGEAVQLGDLLEVNHMIRAGKARGRANVKGQVVEGNTGLSVDLDNEFLLLD